MNNFSVDYADLYINWANTSLFVIPGTLPTLNLHLKSQPLSRKLFFSDAVLASNYYGFKGEATKLIPYNMIDFIYKIVELSPLKKLQIMKKNK